MKKLRIISLVGARPQFIKAAAISRSAREDFGDRITEMIVHSGQHYDDNMSQIFFHEMEIPEPAHNLGTGSGSHGKMTGAIIAGFEDILIKEKPDVVVVYGDTNTTLAGAIAAAKVHAPVAHVEAGLRSFDKSMPEEINRVLCDHASTFLFTPTTTGFYNLVREGFDPNARPPYSASNPKIDHCGDVMYDNARYFINKAEQTSSVLRTRGLESGFILCTIHRDSNTDNADRLNAIFRSLEELASEVGLPVFIPLHPRTAKMMKQNMEPELLGRVDRNPLLRLGEPVSYFDMLVLEKHARLVITDSGGVQKEAFFFGTPCLILRPESEWKEITNLGAAVLTDVDQNRIISSARQSLAIPKGQYPPIFGDGRAARHILDQLLQYL